MTERELADQFNYTGMEVNARKILLARKFAKPEEVAVMTVLDVCRKILKHFEVVACLGDRVILVDKDKFDEFQKLATYLDR